MIVDHRLTEARQLDSPNQSERPADAGICLLVIHNISLPPGEYGGGYIDTLFLNQLDASAHEYFAAIAELRVSAHLLIDRCGALTQYVPFDRMAWHAGRSSFQGREQCNHFSIGIELEGCDHDAFTAAQYRALVLASRQLLQHYPGITVERITGHSNIAPGRKTDPGPFFDWQRYFSALRQDCS